MTLRLLFLFVSSLLTFNSLGQTNIKQLQKKGDSSFQIGDYKAAEGFFNEAITLCQNCSDLMRVNLLVGQGRALQLQEKYDLAYLTLKKAVSISSTFKGSGFNEQINALVALSEYHRNAMEFQESKRLINLATPLVNKEGVSDRNKANYYNRFAALVNEYNHNPDSVIILSEQALVYARGLNDGNLISTSLNEIAYIEEHHGDIEKSIKSYREAADIWKRNQNYRSAGTALYNLARVYNKLGRNATAVKIANEGIDLVTEENWYSILVDLYSIRTISLFDMKDFENGAASQAKYYEATIYLRERENNLGMTKIKNKLEIKQKNEKLFAFIKDNRKAQLQLKSERIRYQIADQNKWDLIYILIIGGILLISSVFITLRSLRVNRKLKWLVESRQLLLKEVHHRVKNNMQTVSSLLDLQTLFVNDAVALNAIQMGKDRINSLALAHQNLYVNNKYDSIDLKQYIESIANSVIPKDVVFELYMEELDFEIEKAQSVGFIVNELMMNSIKHAWDIDATEKNISLTFRKCEEEKGMTWCMEYQDSGSGVVDKKKFKESPTFGVTIINTFLKRNLKGNYHFGDSSGMHLCFEFN